MTECTQSQFPFEAHFSRHVVAQFDGGQLSTEGGAPLLRQVDRRIGLLRRVTRCFSDARDPERIEHPLGEMLAQRIHGLALGYEDLNDHEELRHDPLLALAAGRRDLTEPLAGKSTLNRMELARANSALTERYHRITYSAQALDALLVDIFLEAHPEPPREIVLDLDVTDTPLHGEQEGASFTAITATTVTCRSTSSVESICCARGCGPPIRTPAQAVSSRCSASWRRYGPAGRRRRSSCAPTPGSAARN